MDARQAKQPLIKQRGFRLFLMISPFVALTLLLSYLPLYGWAYAFFNYKPGLPLTSERFVGFANFVSIFSDSYAISDILRVLRNTFALSLLNIAALPLPMAFAIFLSELRSTRFKKIVQTLTTIPNFISWILVYAVAYSMFSVGDGFINRFLVGLGLWKQPVNILASSKNVWVTMLLYSTWKSLGWNAIMYFAAMASIDQEQYEAARVDGAGRWASILHITIPGLMPTFFTLLILSIANFINNGMEQYFVFQNPMNRNFIEVLDLYVYNQGIQSINYSFSIAVSMLKSLVSLVLLFFAGGLSKWVRGESIL